MDFSGRAGNKGAGIAGSSESNVDRRDRLRKLALETIDLAKDPYLLKNHLGGLECRLCLTLHTNEGSYLAHTQGKKHQTNLARRAAREAKENAYDSNKLITASSNVEAVPKKSFVKIGRPGYKVTKVREPVLEAQGVGGGGRLGLLFQISLPEIKEGVTPMHRFMGAFEQKVEPADRNYQYLVVAAEPYETIAFKLQSKEIDRRDTGLLTSAAPGARPRAEPSTWSHYDPDAKTFSVQVIFK
ncbi:related to PRP11 - pre-mRNA splicing factor [Melanopsichium pennsylvanicum]|uniref:Related to PRP11 - pre-mRNA splicing factor n=2 Tax=Melanopsichium pennsylvanicum TaxID=63383 RepID=A0AAJ4XMC6_9BASI|nr:related to PRP11-pre-mRNA splicing factor [Melanopsichium pennsylvanicum 4]SNX83693.1 related to PRP11 - pre-mRNA splicing factor [Melanopsichium pennsylvanicum]